VNIIPAIISEDFEGIEEKIDMVGGFVDWVQIDVVDGVFAQPKSWPYTEVDQMKEISRLNDFDFGPNLELHLMIKNPEETLDAWLDTPAKRIFVHYESTDDIEQAIMILDMSSAEAGISLNMDTPIEVLEPYMDRIDAVQLMSIPEIGSYGAEFDEDVLTKIETLREMYPEVSISVDGGINLENIAAVKSAGADNAAAGSAIYKSDNYEEIIQQLKSA